MTNTNSPTYAQISEIMRAAFDADSPQAMAYIDDVECNGQASCSDDVPHYNFSGYWLAVARHDYHSAKGYGGVPSDWLQDARQGDF